MLSFAIICAKELGLASGFLMPDLVQEFTQRSCSPWAHVSLVSTFPVFSFRPAGNKHQDVNAYELGSVTDLSRFNDKTFDAALAFGGVLSYTFERTPQALAELVRVTRPGGWLGLSVMNLFGTIHTYLPGVLADTVEINNEIVASGDLDRKTNDGHECHLFRPEEIRTLLEANGVHAVELHANGWLIPSGGVEIPEDDPAVWQFLFDAELAASRESPGAGTHIIAWGRVS